MNFGGIAVFSYCADGSPDPTFVGGSVVTPLGRSSRGASVALQPDGRIVVAGWAQRSMGRTGFALARYATDGLLDPAFGDGGLVTKEFDPPEPDLHTDAATSVLLQPDGRIVAVGTTGFPGEFALARFDEHGDPDASFDGDGAVVTDFGGDDKALAAVLQADGKIVVAGLTADDGGEHARIALARYLRTGALDPSFDDDSRVITDLVDPDERATGIAVQRIGGSSSRSPEATISWSRGIYPAAPGSVVRLSGDRAHRVAGERERFGRRGSAERQDRRDRRATRRLCSCAVPAERPI